MMFYNQRNKECPASAQIYMVGICQFSGYLLRRYDRETSVEGTYINPVKFLCYIWVKLYSSFIQ